MKWMFYKCTNLRKINNMNNFNTSNITNMKWMFCGCEKLSELNLNAFNTEKVTNMGKIFNESKNLKVLDLSNFSIEYVENITFMMDLKILVLTVKSVLLHEGISSATSDTMEDFNGTN